jgi:DNA-binding IscR family transcriptional regulator
MQFSSRFTIAIHILLAINEFEGQFKTTSFFLGNSVNVNPVIIRKTLGQLKDAGLVTVEAGVGGASLAKEPKKITLWDVFCAVEDKKEELFHFHDPNPDCPVGANMHAVMDGRLRKFKRNLQKDLDGVTLQDLVKDLRKELKKGRRLWFASAPAAAGAANQTEKAKQEA